MGGWNPVPLVNALMGACEIETRALPNTVVPNSTEPCYPRIWYTGTLENDIRAMAGNVIYYTNVTTATVTVTQWGWNAEDFVGTETGAGSYVQEARYGWRPRNADTVSPEDLDRYEHEARAAHAAAQERAAAEQERRESAETAERLLVSCLDDLQRREWEAGKAFTVHASGRRYRLAHAHEPRRIDIEGRVLFTYCIHTPHVPRCDELLTHKLLLEADEGRFLSTANATASSHAHECIPPNHRGRVGLGYPVAPDVQLAVAA